MNIPNLLTSLRIVASFFFLYFGLHNDWNLALPVFCAAAATDMIDGALARLLKQRTSLGGFLDPMADKLLLFFSFVTLTLHHYIPVELTILVILRDLMIISGLFYLQWQRVSVAYKPTYLSKANTLFQVLTVFVALVESNNLFPFLVKGMPYLVWITSFLTVTTGVHYFVIGWRILNHEAV